VHIMAKRRAALTLYLIHWSYSVYHCLPSFNCADIGAMPAPSPRFLWAATDRAVWERHYGRWVELWEGKVYFQWEFFGIEPGVRVCCVIY